MVDGPAAPRFAPGEIVLAHDWLVGLRGGERVLDRLARAYGPTDLLVLVDAGAPLTEAIRACRARTSLLQRVPGAAGRLRRHLLPLMPLAVDRLRVPRGRLLLSTSSGFIKSLRPPPGVPHLCYCHSPARYLWEQTEDYGLGAGGRLRTLGLRTLGPALRRWDRRTSSRVDRFLANSAHTAARIERCYGRRAAVVHPPVRTDFFTPGDAAAREDFMLVVSALEPYKRTDLAIEASRVGGFPLVVAGDGTQAEALRQAAPDSVRFVGRVPDEEIRDLMRRARGLFFPQQEDFGIVAAEALAAGCPVVARDAGGARDIVAEGTGLLVADPTPEAFADAARRLAADPPDAQACRRAALRFSEARFDREIGMHVDELLAG